MQVVLQSKDAQAFSADVDGAQPRQRFRDAFLETAGVARLARESRAGGGGPCNGEEAGVSAAHSGPEGAQNNTSPGKAASGQAQTASTRGQAVMCFSHLSSSHSSVQGFGCL